MTQIGFFIKNFKLGGAQRIYLNLITEFSSRGYDPELILLHREGELLAEVPEDVSIVNLNADPIIPGTRKLRRHLKRSNLDVLISTINAENLAALMAVNSLRDAPPHIVRLANATSEVAKGYTTRLSDRPIPILMRLLYPRADHVIAVSEGLADDFSSYVAIDPDRVRTIYNPAVTDSMLEKAAEPVDHPWVSNPAVSVVLGVGSLTEQKDFPTLMKAFAQLSDSPPTRLIILGEGPERQSLEKLATDLEISRCVEMPGNVKNPYSFMVGADVFVLSSRWEGCPNVLIEAMACGCPVVATDCPYGPREILNNGELGELVPVGGYNEMHDAIEKSLKRPVASAQLRDRTQDFHIDAIADEYEATFDYLISQQSYS